MTMSAPAQPDRDDNERGLAALPVPEAAATSPWALAAIAVGALVSVLLWRRRAKA
jgi:hypothetical protein